MLVRIDWPLKRLSPVSILQPLVLCFCPFRLRPLHRLSHSGLVAYFPLFLCLVADLTTILFGSAFWGVIYTAGVLFGIVTGVSFFVIWPVSGFPTPYYVTICDCAMNMYLNIPVHLISNMVTFLFNRSLGRSSLSLPGKSLVSLWLCWPRSWCYWSCDASSSLVSSESSRPLPMFCWSSWNAGVWP